MPLAHIAILDDEPEITAMLRLYLSSHGYRVSELHQGSALMELMRRDAPALVLLDLGLPGEDGLAIARQLRQTDTSARLGLVIISGRGDAVDKVVGLEIGADDYITKPFDMRELLARVKAVLRRTEATPGTVAPEPAGNSAGNGHRHRFADFALDCAAHRLLGPDGNEVALTAGEFDLLSVFVQNPGRVLSRDFLLEHTRGREAAPFDRAVDVLIGRLRKKIEADAQQPQILKSVRGAGYILVAAVSAG